VEKDNKKLKKPRLDRLEEDEDEGVNWVGNAAARNKNRDAKKAAKTPA
jgi:hypothetical protein